MNSDEKVEENIQQDQYFSDVWSLYDFHIKIVIYLFTLATSPFWINHLYIFAPSQKYPSWALPHVFM